MSVFGTLQRSTCRHQILTFLQPILQYGSVPLASSQQQQQRQYTQRRNSEPWTTVKYKMEKFFIDALVQACSCREHARLPSTRPSISKPPYIYHKARRRHDQSNLRHTRSVHVYVRPSATHTSVSRDEYKQMLDYYLDPLDAQPQNKNLGLSILALAPLEAQSHMSTFQEKDADKDSTGPPSATAKEGASEDEQVMKRFVGYLEDENSSQEEIMQAYSTLPYPGVSYLSDGLHRLLLRRISVVEKKNYESMMRYLSVVDDMKAADLPMVEAEWNSAIAFAGRCFTKVSATEVELALRTWKEMEHEAKVQGGNVTFNILFDIATKAGKFVLAEMILKEMNERKLRLNRFARVGIIYYHGLRGDGDGVRQAYRALVDAGEIIDTVVMNCVIASLIRAGEPAAADQVYERMKVMFTTKTGSPVPQDWKAVRAFGRVLDRAARVLRADPIRRLRLQDETCLAPNLHTYAIFIEHHVAHTGELRRITALLDEMQFLGVPMHGRIFVKLFRGFARYGGVRYTSWTRARLESVWAALLMALDHCTPDVSVQRWMVVWAVQAFGKCCGRERTLEVWEELRSRWKEARVEDEQAVAFKLREVLGERSGGDGGDWDERYGGYNDHDAGGGSR